MIRAILVYGRIGYACLCPEAVTEHDRRTAMFMTSLAIYVGWAMMAFAFCYSIYDFPTRPVFQSKPEQTLLDVTALGQDAEHQLEENGLIAIAQITQAQLIVPPRPRESGARVFVPLTGSDWQEGDAIAAIMVISRVADKHWWNQIDAVERRVVSDMGLSIDYSSPFVRYDWNGVQSTTTELRANASIRTDHLRNPIPDYLALMNEAGMRVDKNTLFLNLDEIVVFKTPLWWRLSEIFSEVSLVFFIVGISLWLLPLLLRRPLIRYRREHPV